RGAGRSGGGPPAWGGPGAARPVAARGSRLPAGAGWGGSTPARWRSPAGWRARPPAARCPPRRSRRPGRPARRRAAAPAPTPNPRPGAPPGRPSGSPSPGMHLQPRILAELLGVAPGPASLERQPLLRPAVGPGLPADADQGGDLLVIRPAAQGRPEVRPPAGVEAEEPRAVGSHPAPVAGAAEGSGGRGDDA